MPVVIKEHTDMKKPMYYDFRWVLSKDRLISVIMGIRGGGKTYGATSLCIDRFLKKGEKTIWMRRLATEIDKVFLSQFFKDMESKYKDYDFGIDYTDVIGMAYGKIKPKNSDNWERFMLFMPLSISLKHKSVVMNEYNLIICDEWFIDTMHSNLRYINGWNEPQTFYEFFESVVRTREDVRVIMIANAISSVNPYFSEWGVKITDDVEWWMNEFICIHNYKNDTYKDVKEQTTWGRFIANTKYGKYNMENAFLNDTDDFIEIKSAEAKRLYNIFYLGSTWGVWVDNKQGKIYISTSCNNTGLTYCFTTEDMKPNLYLIDNIKSTSNRITMTIKRAYKNGYLYFDNQEIKQKMMEVLNLIM